MKRKYPVSFFLLGVLQNMIRGFIIGLVGLVFLIIGVIGVSTCTLIGSIILICYLSWSVIGQLFIRFTCLQESDNPEFNQLLDAAFGENNHNENLLSAHERIIKIVEEKIKSQNTGTDV